MPELGERLTSNGVTGEWDGEQWRRVKSDEPGMLAPGNINLKNRPHVKNEDGTVSSVRSLGVNFDGREILIPTVSEDGRIMSDDEAIKQFQSTGRHLGIFDTPEHSTTYAQKLHEEQAAMTEEPSALRRFAGGVGEQLNPASMVRGITGAVAHPIDTASAIAGQMGNQWSRGLDDAAQGRMVEGMGHTFAGSIPLVGPAAAAAGEQIASGDVAGGLGRGVGLAGSMLIPGGAGRAGSAVKRAGTAAAEAAAKGIAEVAPVIAEVGVKPAIAAVKAGGKALWEGKGATAAVLHGAKAGVETAVKPFMKEIEAQVKRNAPEVPALKGAEKAIVEHRVAREAKVAGGSLTVKEVKSMADELQEVVMQSHAMGVRPDKIADAVRVRFGSKVQGLTDAAARKMTEQVLKSNGIDIAPIKKLSMNEKIRAAREAIK